MATEQAHQLSSFSKARAEAEAHHGQVQVNVQTSMSGEEGGRTWTLHPYLLPQPLSPTCTHTGRDGGASAKPDCEAGRPGVFQGAANAAGEHSS
jgi:hypothetical protein